MPERDDLSIVRSLRESERRYRSIFEFTGVSIWEDDFSLAKAAIEDLKAQGVRDFRPYFAAHRDVFRRVAGLVRVVDVNETTVKMFGAGSKEELLASLHKLRTPETAATFMDLLVDIAEGRTFREGEMIVRNLQGRRMILLYTISFPPAATGFDRLLIAVIDITRRKEADEALQEAHAELAHVARVTTLGEMTASIAHEVNQPLAAIVADATAALNWLAAPKPDLQRACEALEAIVRDSHRAGDVIQRIRQLATRGVPQRTPVNVDDVVRDIVPLIGIEVRGHAVDLRLDLASSLPPVAADRVQLQQVLINLALNGIEAMSGVSGRPKQLVIHSQRSQKDVVVAVEDAGVGVDPQRVDEIFKAFFSPKPGGMGIGRSISRSIIEEHGGRRWVAANPVYGATFSFALPALS